ncbi:MAG: hypothetical protein L3J01_01895, partial [Thiomicrorhabdus sp.]|nr:hypothetical protein [Thiomicrorhabdus sp.]
MKNKHPISRQRGAAFIGYVVGLTALLTGLLAPVFDNGSKNAIELLSDSVKQEHSGYTYGISTLRVPLELGSNGNGGSSGGGNGNSGGGNGNSGGGNGNSGGGNGNSGGGNGNSGGGNGNSG